MFVFSIFPRERSVVYSSDWLTSREFRGHVGGFSLLSRRINSIFFIYVGEYETTDRVLRRLSCLLLRIKASGSWRLVYFGLLASSLLKRTSSSTDTAWGLRRPRCVFPDAQGKQHQQHCRFTISEKGFFLAFEEWNDHDGIYAWVYANHVILCAFRANSS